MGPEGTERGEGSAKSVQDGTERDEKGPDGRKATELQDRALQVHLPITSPPRPTVRERLESCRAVPLGALVGICYGAHLG